MCVTSQATASDVQNDEERHQDERNGSEHFTHRGVGGGRFPVRDGISAMALFPLPRECSHSFHTALYRDVTPMRNSACLSYDVCTP
jgi:hypothetical protein